MELKLGHYARFGSPSLLRCCVLRRHSPPFAHEPVSRVVDRGHCTLDRVIAPNYTRAVQMGDVVGAASDGRAAVHDLLASALKIVDYLQDVQLSGQASGEVERLVARCVVTPVAEVVPLLHQLQPTPVIMPASRRLTRRVVIACAGTNVPTRSCSRPLTSWGTPSHR